MAIRITCDGDAESGWSVEIHDGDKAVTYSPSAPTGLEAILGAMQEHWPHGPAADGEGMGTPPTAV